MRPLTRRSLVRGAAVAGPVTALLGPRLNPDHALALPTDALAPTRFARGSATCAADSRVPQLLAADMTGRHQGRMHGVPSTYNWAKGPHLDVGNHPGSYTAVSAWGQVYEWIDGSPATNVRVDCRDIALWILSRSTGRWQRTNASRAVNGANYVEDFASGPSQPAPLRDEGDGSVSSTLGGGYNFHLYSTRVRSVIDPGDVGGVVSVYSARVVMDDPHGPDERSQARYLASAGADYWLDSKVGTEDGVTNNPVGCGKARFLTSQWQTVSMSTLPLRKLERNPPPVCLRGR